MIVSLSFAVIALADPAGFAPLAEQSAAQPRTFDALPTYEDVGLRWTRAPSIRDLARQHRVSTRFFPYRGVVELACTPDVRGRLDCDVLNESPSGEGFAKAAYWVMRPVRVASIDGYSPAGRTFAFRLRFGNWPESILPDRYHPVDQNLRWVKRPELQGYGLSGLLAQQEAQASFECVARADGFLDCRSTDRQHSLPGFVEAAARSLEGAQVERTDSGVLEGSPLKWTIRVRNQSNCGTGGTGYGEPDAGRGAVAANAGDIGTDPLSALGSTGGSAAAGRGAGNCLGAFVQVH